MCLKQIKAFTLVELMVSLLLSGLITTAVFGALLVLTAKHREVEKEQQAFLQVPLLNGAITQDIRKGAYVLQVQDGFVCVQDSARVYYLFADSGIIRLYQGEKDVIDTFHVQPLNLKLHFKKGEVPQGAPLVEAVVFDVHVQEATLSLNYSKHYDAATLINLGIGKQ